MTYSAGAQRAPECRTGSRALHGRNEIRVKHEKHNAKIRQPTDPRAAQRRHLRAVE